MNSRSLLSFERLDPRYVLSGSSLLALGSPALPVVSEPLATGPLTGSSVATAFQQSFDRLSNQLQSSSLEGDPDQPIITGRVYNDAQMPPTGLPGNQTASGWKSNSSPGGGGTNRDAAFDGYTSDNFSLFRIQQDGTVALVGSEMVLKGKKILQN